MQKIKSFLQRTASYWIMLALSIILLSNYQVRIGWDHIHIDHRAFFKGFNAGEQYGAEKGFEKGYQYGSYNAGKIHSEVLVDLDAMDIRDILLEEGIIMP